jgi:hypothetical protein
MRLAVTDTPTSLKRLQWPRLNLGRSLSILATRPKMSVVTSVGQL